MWELADFKKPPMEEIMRKIIAVLVIIAIAVVGMAGA
jgi:hypothetical protein